MKQETESIDQSLRPGTKEYVLANLDSVQKHRCLLSDDASWLICILIEERKRLEVERDRQYEFNVEQIAKYAALEAHNAKLMDALSIALESRELSKYTRGKISAIAPSMQDY